MPTPKTPRTEQNEYTYDGQFESNTDLVIGIDFGTTFSGVAYANPTKISTNKLFSRGERKNIADIVVVKAWPGAAQLEKIQPSYLIKQHRLYGALKSGLAITYEPRIAHFKLGLEENVAEHYKIDSPSRRQSAGRGSPLGGYLTDSNWSHPLSPRNESRRLRCRLFNRCLRLCQK